MSRIILLDSGPLGLVTQRPGKRKEVDDCLRWLASFIAAGHRIVVPEIADYEVRRELIRAKQATGIARLDTFNNAEPDRYLPLTTAAIRRAAELWAEARNTGLATTDPKALDADVILAAQVQLLAQPDKMVATGNPRHLSRFVPADLWSNIHL